MVPIVAAFNALTVVTRWLTPSILLLLSARIIIGEGSIKRHFAMTAFASLPLLFQHVLRVLDSFIITPLELSQLTASRLVGTGLTDRLLNQGLTVLNFFGFITLALTIFAMRENYETKTTKATQVVLLGYIGYIIIRMFLPFI
jgi:hypothetical protein